MAVEGVTTACSRGAAGGRWKLRATVTTKAAAHQFPPVHMGEGWHNKSNNVVGAPVHPKLCWCLQDSKRPSDLNWGTRIS